MGQVKKSRGGEGSHPLSTLSGPRICCLAWSGSRGGKQDSLKLQGVAFVCGDHLGTREPVSRTLPDLGALTHPPSPPSPRRKTGAKSPPGAQHRGEPQVGEPLDAGYIQHGLPCLGHGPSPHGRHALALPEESGPPPWVH